MRKTTDGRLTMCATLRATAAVLVLLCPAAALGQALPLVTGPAYPPFTDEALPEGGMATDLVRTVYKTLGQDATIEFRPWKRGAEETANGTFFATFPYVKNAERLQAYLFSAPLFEVHQIVYVSGDSTLKFNSPADLKGRQACSPLGSAPPPSVQAMIDAGDVSIHSPTDLNACFRMLAAGRVDFYIINEFNGRAAIRDLAITSNQIRAEPKPFATTTLHLIVGKTTAGAASGIARFDEGLARVRANGDYDRIVKKHVGETTAHE